MNTKNKKNGMNPKLRYIIPYIIILFVIIVLWGVFDRANTTNAEFVDLNDYQLVEILNDQSLKYDFIRIESDAETSKNVKGIYKENNKLYRFDVKTEKPYYENTLMNAIANRYEFETTTQPSLQGFERAFISAEINWWSIALGILPYVIIIGFVFYFLFRLSNSANNSNNRAFDFAKSPARSNEVTGVKFADVAGLEEEKFEVVEIIDYLKNPAKYTKMGAKMPKGILLKGPPGTGKTLLAKAVAGEAGVPFHSISGSDFVEMFVGVGASRVRDLFKKAKATAPCIIFIDEIDAVGRQRGTGLGGGHDEREQTLNQLLVEMDGFGENTGVVVIAATNRDDVLDPALLRPGRFDRSIVVNLPDKKGREAILKVHARNKRLASNIDFEGIARRTPGFSGAQLANLLNEAAILAVRENKTAIELSDIDEAIDRVIGGTAKKSRILLPHERKMIAYHESGHAVIGLKLRKAEVVQKVTIIPRGEAEGYVLMTPKEDRQMQTKEELLETICGLLAGRVTEELFFKDVSTGAHNDIERATRIARTMVTQLGMSPLGPIQYEQESGSVFLGRDYNSRRNFSGQVAYEIDREVRNIIEECYQRAKQIITENAKLLVLIAETLLVQETLTHDEILYLVDNGHLPTVEALEEETKEKVDTSLSEFLASLDVKNKNQDKEEIKNMNKTQ